MLNSFPLNVYTLRILKEVVSILTPQVHHGTFTSHTHLRQSYESSDYRSLDTGRRDWHRGTKRPLNMNTVCDNQRLILVSKQTAPLHGSTFEVKSRRGLPLSPVYGTDTRHSTFDFRNLPRRVTRVIVPSLSRPHVGHGKWKEEENGLCDSLRLPPRWQNTCRSLFLLLPLDSPFCLPRVQGLPGSVEVGLKNNPLLLFRDGLSRSVTVCQPKRQWGSPYVTIVWTFSTDVQSDCGTSSDNWSTSYDYGNLTFSHS